MKKLISLLIGVAVLLCIVAAASVVAARAQDGHGQQRLTAQRRAIERAAVLCYALEGAYPPDVDYLEAQYGLVIDRNRFIVHYMAYGANLRPEIAVYAYE